MSELRQAALGYAQRGWSVFPLHGIVNGVCTCGRVDCGSPGKHPLVRRGLHEATRDESVISGWWRQWRSANIGVATGAESGIAVIDVDLPEALGSLDLLIEMKLPPTLTGLTGGGGVHLVYGLQDESLGNSTGRLPGIDHDLPGIDLRGNGGYIVAPPSTHVSGGLYLWMSTAVPIAPLPVWLKQPEGRPWGTSAVVPVDFDGDGTPYGIAVLHGELDRLRKARQGTRNHSLNRSAFVVAQIVGGGELLESHARSALLIRGVEIGLEEWECRQTIDSAFDAGLRQPRCAPHRLKT